MPGGDSGLNLNSVGHRHTSSDITAQLDSSLLARTTEDGKL